MAHLITFIATSVTNVINTYVKAMSGADPDLSVQYLIDLILGDTKWPMIILGALLGTLWFFKK